MAKQTRLSLWLARSAAVALALLVAGGVVRSMDSSPDAPVQDESASHVVTIQNMKYEPAELTVKRGDRVVWINKDMFPHTTTGKSFDSGSIASDASWTLVADEPGDYAYVCTFHPTMQGRLIVR